jgi:hypothetical protein
MDEGAQRMRAELSGLLEKHVPGLTEIERADLLFLESRSSWRPGRRPMRPDPMVTAFLELFDRAEQQELAYHALPPGSLEELRQVFRERMSRAT